MKKVSNDNQVRVRGFQLGPREKAFLSFCGGVEAQLKFQHGKAIKGFQRALQHDSYFVLAAYEMGWSFAAAGRYGEAAGCLLTVLFSNSRLKENYQRIDRLAFYQREKVESGLTLLALYEYFRSFSALQILAENEAAGFFTLQNCLKDQFLSQKTKADIRQIISNLRDIREGKPINPALIMAIQSMLITVNQHILATFEDFHDRRAMEIGFMVQMKIVDKLQQWDDNFRFFRKGIKLGLASVYFDTRRNLECRRLVEEVLSEDPENERANELIDQLRHLN